METRTVIDFRHDGFIVRTVQSKHSIPGLAVGNMMTFDHTSTAMTLHGKVVAISHVVTLDDSPVTYVDVEV